MGTADGGRRLLARRAAAPPSPSARGRRYPGQVPWPWSSTSGIPISIRYPEQPDFPTGTRSPSAAGPLTSRVPGTPDATAMGSVWCPRNMETRCDGWNGPESWRSPVFHSQFSPGDQTSFVSEISERFFLTPSLGLLLNAKMSVCSWRADRPRLWRPLLCDASVTTRRSARCGVFSCPVASATGAFLLGRAGMGRIGS